MTTLLIAGVVTANILSVAALVTASKAIHRTTESEDAPVVGQALDSSREWPKLPTSTHRWSLSEKDGTWTWCVWELHHYYDRDAFDWAWSSMPSVETRESDKPVASGFTDSRKDAEKAIQRWFWREFKGRQTPQFDEFKLGGTWTVPS